LSSRVGLLHPFLCGEYRPNYLVIPGAAAQVPGEPVADTGLVGVRLAVKQCLGGDDEAGCADATLEGRLFKERLLQRMEVVAVGYAFNGGDFTAVDFNRKDATGVHNAAIEHDVTGAAVAVAAAFLGAGQLQFVAEDFQKGLPGITQEIDVTPVETG